MEIELLGRVKVRVRGTPVDLTPKLQLVLACLVERRGDPLSAQRLAEQVAAESDPYDPVKYAHSNIDRLRSKLKAVDPSIDTLIPDNHVRAGYRLSVDGLDVDVHRFQDALKQTRAAGDDAEFVRLSEAALKEWGDIPQGLRGGEPLTGLPGLWAEGYRGELQMSYQNALLAWIEAKIKLAQFRELLPMLKKLSSDPEPDEKIAELLMVSLYRAGRSSEAVRVFERISDRIQAERGVAASPRLEELHLRIKARDPSIDLPPLSVTTLVNQSKEPLMNDDEQQPITETVREEIHPKIDKVGALATGPHGLAIGAQWNVSGTNARIFHSDGDMKIADNPEDET
ncbi:AfsR/SARP family transcriptional regulator [Acrocarpospora corrugata]|uniref:AfsR/SARP family transcriptional regulator n=1 Tax=Acrocarpospora corrugata TaxID=35763 RepID=UPI001478B470|nr:BTAD domain-containing putative transcriptional regulator [Acrocarpospora corrugata]